MMGMGVANCMMVHHVITQSFKVQVEFLVELHKRHNEHIVVVSIKCQIYKFSKTKRFFLYSESTYPASSFYQLQLFTNQSEIAYLKNGYARRFNSLIL